MKKIFVILLLAGASIFIIVKYSKIFESEDSSYSSSNNAVKNEQPKANLQNFDLEINSKDSKAEPFFQKNISFALEIKGSEEFKIKVKNAIRLLWLYDRDGSYALLRRYVFRINESNRTCFIIQDDKTPVIEISSTKAKESSLTFLASIIAHNAWHAYYQIETEKKKNMKIDVLPPGKERIDKTFTPPFPYSKKFSDVFSVEKEAFEYQYKILEKIGANELEKKLILKRKHNDFSLSHDGNYIVYF